jgi:hypothetical protein
MAGAGVKKVVIFTAAYYILLMVISTMPFVVSRYRE